MKNDSQADRAYKILKHKILDQELRQGAPVVESEIAAELDMSRTPVRDAIRRLDSDGLLEIIPRKGSYIRTFSITDLIGIYEIAEGLEGMVAYLVAEKYGKGEIPSSAIEELEGIIGEMDELDGNFRVWSEADERFHQTLYYLAGNEFIVETLVRIRTQLNITLLNVIPSYLDVEKSNEEHKGILKEIKAGRPEQARTINQQQHNRVRNSLLEHSRIGG